MIKQLKDINSFEDIYNGSSNCVTYFLSTATFTNTVLQSLLVTNYETMSLEYLGNRLDKALSPLVNRILEVADIDDISTDCGRIILNKFSEKWERLANALFSDYNPIENYRMVEAESEGKNTKVNTEMTTETEEHETNKYSGFDSSEFKDTTATDKDGSSETTGTKAKNEQAETGNRNLTRSGNIGVTTSQQMIESEVQLRKHNLLNIIYDDMDSILFLDYYC